MAEDICLHAGRCEGEEGRCRSARRGAGSGDAEEGGMQGMGGPEWPWSDDTDGTWHLLLQMYSRDWMMAGRGEGGRARGQDFTNPSQGITSLGLDSGSPGKPLLICRQRRSSLERRVWRSTKAGK